MVKFYHTMGRVFLWALLRREPRVPILSAILHPLWFADAMGIDLIRLSSAECVGPAELVSLLSETVSASDT